MKNKKKSQSVLKPNLSVIRQTAKPSFGKKKSKKT